MRSITGLAVAAVLAATAATLPASNATSAPAQDAVGSARAALAAHPAASRDVTGQAYVVKDTLVDADGSTHVRFDRTLHGLEVLGGDLVVHQSRSGAWKGVSQTLRAPLTLAVKPAVSGASAEAVALKAPAQRRITGEQVQDRTLKVDATRATPRLVWEVVTGGVQADGTPSRLASYVDARTGRFVRSEQQIETIDGQGQSLYSGAVGLSLTLANGTYSMKDPLRGNGTVGDVKNATDSIFCTLFGIFCPAVTVFSGSDNVFGNGATSSRESAGVDAAYGTSVTWDYFKSTHGRNGIWNNGTGAPSRVHYGSNYVNAFWDGKQMTYGDGDGTSYGPLVSLDVAGHEMSHGVTENSANLTYSGESGGLNEATSDIFGSLVEFHAANSVDKGDYYIGERFDLAQHDGFRRMDKPSSDGKSFDCWNSTVGNADVHYSSGVGNHFFYLLAEGTGTKTIGDLSHTSATCNGTTLTGIGSAKAGKIWYRALTVYMTSSTNYAGARTATLSAAKDLYGDTSVEYNAVKAAWSGVSVN